MSNTWLDNLKVGDKVIVKSMIVDRQSLVIRRIVSISETEIIDDEDKLYHRETGKSLVNSWISSSIHEASEEEAIKINRKTMLIDVKTTNFGALSDEKLSKILEIINTPEK